METHSKLIRGKSIEIGSSKANAKLPDDRPALNFGRLGACGRNRMGADRSDEVLVRLGGDFFTKLGHKDTRS